MESVLQMRGRLGGLVPDDFGADVAFLVLDEWQSPMGFETVWHNVQHADVCDISLDMTSHEVILFVGDLRIQAHVQRLSCIIEAIEQTYGQDIPPMILVPHAQCSRPMECTSEMSAIERLMDTGLDDILRCEPSGFDLALHVKASLGMLSRRTSELSDAINQRRHAVHVRDRLKGYIEHCMWDYLRSKIAPEIPSRDEHIDWGVIKSLHGRQIGPKLGHGAYGAVYKLSSTGGICDDVVKLVDKAAVCDASSLLQLKRAIEIMTLLSSDRWSHPNVTQFFQLYHSRTHLLFRMDYAGPRNLLQQLAAAIPLSRAAAVSLMQQAAIAVAHLHSGPGICHRDLKPESFIVQAAGSSLMLKLTDFDLAALQKPGDRCCSVCGTMPFVAPEVFGGTYCGFSADVWSLALVLLEVQCGLHVVAQVLKIDLVQFHTAGHDAEVMGRIADAFMAPDAVQVLLERRSQTQLRAMLKAVARVLCRMLLPKPSDRCTAANTAEALGTM